MLWSRKQRHFIASIACSWNLSSQANKKVQTQSRTSGSFLVSEASWFVIGNKNCYLAPLHKKHARRCALSSHLVNDKALRPAEISGQLVARQVHHPFLLFTWSHRWAFEVKQKIWCKTLRNAALQRFFRFHVLKLILLLHKKIVRQMGVSFHLLWNYSQYYIWCGQRSVTFLFSNFCFLLSASFFSVKLSTEHKSLDHVSLFSCTPKMSCRIIKDFKVQEDFTPSVFRTKVV